MFNGGFDEFRESVADLAHCEFVMEWGIKEAKNSVNRSLAVLRKRRQSEDSFAGGNAITVTNVFRPNNKFPIRAPGGVRTVEGKRILELMDEMRARFHSYLLVATYERFEVLLKDYYAMLLYQLRGVVLPRKAKFHKEQPSMARKANTLPYFRVYAGVACRQKCDEAITAFAKKLPLQTMTYTWHHGMPFQSILKCLSFCRNAIVHEEGRWPTGKISLNKAEQEFVRSYMRISTLTNESTILPNHAEIDNVMEMLVSYAYGLYVLFSRQFNMVVANSYFK